MNAVVKFEKNTITNRLASRFGVDEREVFSVLKQTAFKTKDKDGHQASDAQMTALMIVADQYGLNPFTKELYAYPDKQNGIVPVVSVDGWTRIINEHGAMNGIEFRYSDDVVTMKDGKACPSWCEAIFTRKDREKPIVIREYLDEVYCNKRGEYGGPWQSHTKRMLRHKALIQGARVAFGFAGIYDEDEAQRIVERDVTADGSHTTTQAETRAVEKTVEYWTDDEFTKNLPAWSKPIINGQKNADYMIAFVCQRKQLTDEQKAKIRAVKAPEVHEALATADQLTEIVERAGEATVTMAEIGKRFSITNFDAIPAALVPSILEFISNPMGA